MLISKNISSIFESMEDSYTYVVVTGDSTVELEGNISPMIWSSLCIQSVVKSNAVRFHTLMLTTDCSVYPSQTIDLWWVLTVNKGCLHLLGTWSYLWYIHGFVFAMHTFFSFFVDNEIYFGALSLPFYSIYPEKWMSWACNIWLMLGVTGQGDSYSS